MKRFFAILLCLVMVCALVACNNSTPITATTTTMVQMAPTEPMIITGTRPITVVQSMELRTA